MKHVFNTLLAIVLLLVIGLVLGQHSAGIRFGDFSFAQGSNSFRVPCGGVDDTANVQLAGNTSGTWNFDAGVTCIVNAGVTISANNVIWRVNGSTIKRLSSTGDTTHYMLNSSGGNFKCYDCIFDVGGVTAGPDASHDYLVYDGGGFSCYNCTLQNSGTPQSGMSGILAYQANLEVAGGAIAPTILGAGILHDGGGVITNVKIHDLIMSGSTTDEIFIQNGIAGTQTTIADTQCSAVTSSSGTGQNGNCIVVFQRLGNTQITGNSCYNTTYSCVRLNNSINVTVAGNHCDSSNENCFYSEFGAEGNVFSGNIASNSYAGFENTNIGSRVNGIPDTFTGNSAFNILGYCFHIENAQTSGNTCTSAPVGIEVGFGGTGFGNTINGFAASHVTIPVPVDKTLSSTPNNIVGIVTFQSPNNASQTSNVQALDLPTTVNITAATKASPLVLTTSSSLPTLDNVLMLRFFNGMTQANGVLCRVASPSGSTFSCHTLAGANIDSTMWGTYNASPPAGSAGVGLLLYSSGTTPAFSIPSVVQQLTIP